MQPMAEGAIRERGKGLSKGAGSVRASPCCFVHLLQPAEGGQVQSPQQGDRQHGGTGSFGLGRGKFLCVVGQEEGLDLFEAGKVSALRRRLEKIRVEHPGARETSPGGRKHPRAVHEMCWFSLEEAKSRARTIQCLMETRSWRLGGGRRSAPGALGGGFLGIILATKAARDRAVSTTRWHQLGTEGRQGCRRTSGDESGFKIKTTFQN